MAEASAPTPQITDRLVTQPGRVVCAVPSFAFVLPKGWVIDEAPGAVTVIRLPGKVNDFWVNAMLTHDKVARSVDFVQAAKVTWAKLQRSVNGLVERGEKLLRFNDLPLYVRGCEFASADGGQQLAQMHAIWFGPVSEGGKVVDMFQLVLTAPTAAMATCSTDMLELLATFRFT